MCLACELGYWAAVDAVEAERKARPAFMQGAADAVFDCKPADAEPLDDRESGHKTDEPA